MFKELCIINAIKNMGPMLNNCIDCKEREREKNELFGEDRTKNINLHGKSINIDSLHQSRFIFMPCFLHSFHHSNTHLLKDMNLVGIVTMTTDKVKLIFFFPEKSVAECVHTTLLEIKTLLS